MRLHRALLWMGLLLVSCRSELLDGAGVAGRCAPSAGPPLWPQPYYDAHHRSQSPLDGPSAPGVRWISMDVPEAIVSPPVVAGDGAVLVCGAGGTLYAFDGCDGHLSWTAPAGHAGPLLLTEAGDIVVNVAFDGTIDYAGRRPDFEVLDGRTHAPRWKAPAGCHQAMLDGDRIYSACEGVDAQHPILRALRASDGAILWERPLALGCTGNGCDTLFSVNGLGPGGQLLGEFYEGCIDCDSDIGIEVAISTDGSIEPLVQTGFHVAPFPFAGRDGAVLAFGNGISDDSWPGSGPQWLEGAYPGSPERRWQHDAIGGSLAVAADGTVEICGASALSPSGQLEWQQPIPGTCRGPVLDGHGTLYFLGGDGRAARLYAIDPSGTVLWSEDAGVSDFVFGPAIGASRTLFVVETSPSQSAPKRSRIHAFGD